MTIKDLQDTLDYYDRDSHIFLQDSEGNMYELTTDIDEEGLNLVIDIVDVESSDPRLDGKRR